MLHGLDAFSTFTGMVGLKALSDHVVTCSTHSSSYSVEYTPVASREQCPISNYFNGVLHGIVRGISYFRVLPLVYSIVTSVLVFGVAVPPQWQNFFLTYVYLELAREDAVMS